MTLQHTIMMPLDTGGLGIGSALKIQQGGHSTVSTNMPVQCASTNYLYVRRTFVWDGNVYLPIGGDISTAYGCWKYNHATDLLERLSEDFTNGLMIPLFDRIGILASSEQGWGYSPEDRRAGVGTITGAWYDYATNGIDVALIQSGGNMYDWSYPFTSIPTIGAALSATSRRVCELGGKFYIVNINSAGGLLMLYEYVGGSINLVGTPSSHVLTNHDPTSANQMSLFKYNNKLFILIATNTTSQQKYRLFEFNVSTGASVEQNSYLPAAWQGLSANSASCITEVRDSISPNEQVFLIAHNYSTTGWECYEFQEGSFIFVDSGTQQPLPGGGAAVYDHTAKAAQYKSAVDSTPSSYVRTEIEVFDLYANGLVDIDPRYRWNNAESPPYLQMTGKAPNNVVTNLSSAPTRSLLSDLDDDFEDGTVDEELWQSVSLAIHTSTDRDIGYGYRNASSTATPAYEVNGAVRFGRASEAQDGYTGRGIRSKSRISGAFQIDIALADPENLLAFSIPNRAMVIYVRVAVNEGYGVVIWRSSTGPQVYVRGIYMRTASPYTWIVSADFAAADGDVIRIVRDGSDVWAITHDPAGAANDLTPAGGSNYSAEVEIIMGGWSASTTSWVAAGVPVGSEPGFYSIAVSGAGSPGNYQGGVKHTFDWDHATDLGAGQTGMAELFVDTQRS